MSDATPDADSSQHPRQRTQAQIEASRSNGARGRGPATPEGKAASCQNAAKHGLRAQGFALLPDEDAGAFVGLRQRLVEEHDPRGAVEEALVEQLALALWRTRRVEALEVEALTSARERRPSPVYAGRLQPLQPVLVEPRTAEHDPALPGGVGAEPAPHAQGAGGTAGGRGRRRRARTNPRRGRRRPRRGPPYPARTNPRRARSGRRQATRRAMPPAPTGAPDAERAARTNPGRPCHAGGRPAKARPRTEGKKREKKPARRRTRGVKPRTASPPCGPCRRPRA